MTIQITEEMAAVFAGTGLYADEAEVRSALAAVLAIVERDLAGPCPENFHIGLLAATQPLRCNLRAGHTGDHENGGTRWWEASPS
jgi:hypothetical protein